jgi:hypothetical protein
VCTTETEGRGISAEQTTLHAHTETEEERVSKVIGRKSERGAKTVAINRRQRKKRIEPKISLFHQLIKVSKFRAWIEHEWEGETAEMISKKKRGGKQD